MKLLIAALALTIPATAQARGEILWQQVAEGMSVDQVHALFPEVKGAVEWHPEMTELKKYVSVGKCKANVHIRHDTGVVKSVIVFRQNKGSIVPNCPADILAAMRAKYGAPEGHTASETSFLGAEGTEDNFAWSKEGVSITLSLHGDAQNGAWDLKYSSTIDADTNAKKDAEGL